MRAGGTALRAAGESGLRERRDPRPAPVHAAHS